MSRRFFRNGCLKIWRLRPYHELHIAPPAIVSCRDFWRMDGSLKAIIDELVALRIAMSLERPETDTQLETLLSRILGSSLLANDQALQEDTRRVRDKVRQGQDPFPSQANNTRRQYLDLLEKLSRVLYAYAAEHADSELKPTLRPPVSHY